MSTTVEPIPTSSTRTVLAARDAERTAVIRSACYAAWSELTASPHEVDASGAAGQRIGMASELAFATELDHLLEEFVRTDRETLKAQYSELFEIGSQGPPAPIREDLQTGQRAGTREDIIRFYDYFGYRLDDGFAWAPDHLSVELEFMHFLSFHEASDSAERLSYQLAQVDFAERHLANWLPQLAAAVAQIAPGSFYSRVLLELQKFVTDDLAWQAATVATTTDAPHRG